MKPLPKGRKQTLRIINDTLVFLGVTFVTGGAMLATMQSLKEEHAGLAFLCGAVGAAGLLVMWWMATHLGDDDGNA